jgi:hypothetical protein
MKPQRDERSAAIFMGWSSCLSLNGHACAGRGEDHALIFRWTTRGEVATAALVLVDRDRAGPVARPAQTHATQQITNS